MKVHDRCASPPRLHSGGDHANPAKRRVTVGGNFDDDTKHTALASDERHTQVPVVIVIHGHESLPMTPRVEAI